MKRHKVVPLQSMQIDFLDKTLLFSFDMQAITKLQEHFDSLEKVAQNENKFEMAAMFLWAGIKDDSVTLDEAKVMITSNAEVLSDTLLITFDNISKLGGEETSKKLQEEMEKLKKQGLI